MGNSVYKLCSCDRQPVQAQWIHIQPQPVLAWTQYRHLQQVTQTQVKYRFTKKIVQSKMCAVILTETHGVGGIDTDDVSIE